MKNSQDYFEISWKTVKSPYILEKCCAMN